MDFPAAYIIPSDALFQQSPHQAANLIAFLLFNDVQVEKAKRAFEYAGVWYPKGTYIVWMDQPKRGLANTIVEDGLDLSDIEELVFYSPPASWSHPLLWGVSRTMMEEKLDIETKPVKKAKIPRGAIEKGNAGAYAFQPTSIAAFKAANELASRGFVIYHSTEAFKNRGRLFNAELFMIPGNRRLAYKLAKRYKLDIIALDDVPESAVLMESQRIAVYADEGVAFSLGELGFDYDEVTSSDLNSGIDLTGYDVLILGNMYWEYYLNETGISAKATSLFPAFGPVGMKALHTVSPIIVHRDYGLQDVALIGIDPAFRGHPRNTFRILGNAVFSGLERDVGVETAFSIAFLQ